MDDLTENLMGQLEDALKQVATLKADLTAAAKATATAQALLDKAVQERDAAKEASGEAPQRSSERTDLVWTAELGAQRASRARGAAVPFARPAPAPMCCNRLHPVALPRPLCLCVQSRCARR